MFPDWSSNVYHNTLLFALNDNGPNWPNPPWSTLLFRKLIENTEFKNQFINRFCYYYNTRFDPSYVQNHISEIIENIAPEMYNHINRWGGYMGTWNQNINFIQDFGNSRADVVRSHVRGYFGLNQLSNLNLSTVPPEAGSISVSGINISDNGWSGEYFNDIPIDISVSPNPGYIFSNWAADANGTESKYIYHDE